MASPNMIKLTDSEFDRVVKRAIGRIPDEIRQHLDNILITVQKRPSRKMLEEMDLADDETLFGLYWGVSLTDRSVTSPELYPDTIFLFQQPLEESCETIEELEEQIEVTVVHEVGHALGVSEERLEELGYG